ncbi:MAG: hypothetical protein ACRC33_26225 [Gemmataceae bacterium]
MARIVIDDVLKAKLQGLAVPLDLCDETGRVVAQVFPVPKVPIYVGMECPLSQEEIEERIKNPGKLYTGAEIDAMLEKR